MQTSGWVAVRCVFRTFIGREQQFEERVTLWRAASAEEAIMRAEGEARVYADENSDASSTTQYLGFAQAYVMADDVRDGAEVFSLIRVTDVPADQYLTRYYE